ncbi:Putative disease resistance RPP13-like protein 1 [Triticum urartu]|uniref:Putative disease resistance RPP13-like protein 1 n=1 Tax=Triticum urartu TaxID=4572 RepID=M7ZGG1_TRIUA|nr:putative disease resistance RPP13-like protein 1 [Triticum urartu]EMS59152.1 Putative disease resistance RPP13-like protein 1 [Triticum urartu]
MDILVSAIVGDLISRSASFVISRYFQQQPDINKILQRLWSVLLRIDIFVEEAEARHITNQGMLRQLKMLRQGMYRGRYVLDALRFQAARGEEEMSHSSSALSKSSPTKCLRFSRTRSGSSSSNREALLFGTNNNIQDELQRMVDTLEDTVAGMKEFLFFMELYPRILRQPYGMYLLLDNCMFGRQMEREQVLNFLLSPGATSDLAVLPIVGPIRVGKSTLVEHVCRDESVRSHFSMILFFPQGSLRDEGVVDLKRNNINGLVRYRNSASQTRLLIIVEIAEDINEGTWRRLKSSTTGMTPCGGSKIIITSRSDRIVNLGTTEALRLDFLPPEAYWHFFKSLVFRSTNPDEQPKLATMAMEIALELRQGFTSAHIASGILRHNFNARFWCTVLECVRESRQTNLNMFGQHPNLRLREDAPVYCWRLVKSCRYFLIHNYHQSDSSENVPKINLRDIVLGSGGKLPCGEFEALAWKSRIPPYYNYRVSCKMQAPQLTVGRKKRVRQEEEHFV